MDDYKEKREKYVQMFKDGNIPEPCQNCPHVEEKNWNEEIGFTFISISSQTKCNCNCFYCIQSKGNPQTKKILNTRECYDVKPVIKEIYDKNLIKKDCTYIIGGGEPTIIKNGELEYLIYIGLISEAQIMFLTNGIIYNKYIGEALSIGKCSLKISVDAGTKEIYKKIKGVDKYNNVWRNIKKYIANSKNNPNANVQIKYILIPEKNDNIEEIKKFIKKCKSNKIKNIEIDFEYDWFGANKDNHLSDELTKTLKYLRSLQEVSFINQDDWVNKKLASL